MKRMILLVNSLLTFTWHIWSIFNWLSTQNCVFILGYTYNSIHGSCLSKKWTWRGIPTIVLKKWAPELAPVLFKRYNHYQHHPSVSLWFVGTPLTIPFHTARSWIAVTRSSMSNPESRAIMSGKVNFREKTALEICYRSKEETSSMSTWWEANFNCFCLSLRELC